MAKLAKNLTTEEVQCKCGCGLEKISPRTVEMFQRVRDKCGYPLIVTSGCRCEKHNKAVGGVADSAHLPNAYGYCQALDIATPSPQVLFDVVKGLLESGCTRIGINFSKKFIHFDTDETKPQRVIFKY